MPNFFVERAPDHYRYRLEIQVVKFAVLFFVYRTCLTDSTVVFSLACFKFFGCHESASEVIFRFLEPALQVVFYCCESTSTFGCLFFSLVLFSIFV